MRVLLFLIGLSLVMAYSIGVVDARAKASANVRRPDRGEGRTAGI